MHSTAEDCAAQFDGHGRKDQIAAKRDGQFQIDWRMTPLFLGRMEIGETCTVNSFQPESVLSGTQQDGNRNQSQTLDKPE